MGEIEEKGTLVKMKRSDLSKVRDELIAKQGGRCPICGIPFSGVTKQDIVVDHNHKTGVVRAALHRGCNRVEGSVLGTITQWGKAPTMEVVIASMKRLISFWELHSTDQTGIVYYGHKTANEKTLALNKKRRRKAAAKRKES